MLMHTVPNGKCNRGMTVLSALKALSKDALTLDQEFKANTLGWCVEILQAFFLVADDLMDGSITRRGAPWYVLSLALMFLVGTRWTVFPSSQSTIHSCLNQ